MKERSLMLALTGLVVAYSREAFQEQLHLNRYAVPAPVHLNTRLRLILQPGLARPLKAQPSIPCMISVV